MLPGVDQFPYPVKVISDILESNGSSSMASSCGGCLALMDAGVPITKMVAGISVGLVQEGDKIALLTDIMGEEDHFGDMDFKVCGTRDGITAIQLDIKTEGLSYDIIRQTLHRAREARLVILDKMASVLPEPRKEISKNAPCLLANRNFGCPAACSLRPTRSPGRMAARSSSAAPHSALKSSNSKTTA